MQHITGADKNLVYVSIVSCFSARPIAHMHLIFATHTSGGKSCNPRLISGPTVTHMHNGSMKAAEMKPFYILVREEKASRIPHRHSKVRGHRPEVRVSRGGRQTTSSIIVGGLLKKNQSTQQWKGAQFPGLPCARVSVIWGFVGALSLSAPRNRLDKELEL